MDLPVVLAMISLVPSFQYTELGCVLLCVTVQFISLGESTKPFTMPADFISAERGGGSV